MAICVAPSASRTSRGIEVSDAVREQVTACTDHDQLDRWLELAATAESIKDIDERFAE